MLASKQIPEVGKGHLICVMIRFKTLLSGSIPVMKWKHVSQGSQVPDHFTALHDLARSLAMFKRQGYVSVLSCKCTIPCHQTAFLCLL